MRPLNGSVSRWERKACTFSAELGHGPETAEGPCLNFVEFSATGLGRERLVCTRLTVCALVGLARSHKT